MTSTCAREPRILPALKDNSEKQALQELAAKAAQLAGQNERAVFEVLLRSSAPPRSATGSRFSGQAAQAQEDFRTVGPARSPDRFEAMDGLPVDLVFLLLAPEGAGADHLKALAASPAARRRHCQEAQRLARRPGDLFGAVPAAGDLRKLSTRCRIWKAVLMQIMS